MNVDQDVIARLTRADKVSLGGGRMLIWAPEWPLWADRPGFWDHACWLEHRVQPLFTLTLLDEAGGVIPLTLSRREWRPDRLTRDYDAPGLTVREARCLTPDDVLTSHLALTNATDRERRLRLIAWSAQPNGSLDGRPAITPRPLDSARALGWRVDFPGGGLAEAAHTLHIALGADRPSDDWAVHQAQKSNVPNYPWWELAPFAESGFGGQFIIAGGEHGSGAGATYFLGLAYDLTLPANGETGLTVGMALSPQADEASKALAESLRAGPLDLARATWQAWFDGAPRFICSDPWLETAYTYRQFGLRLNRIETGGHFNLPHPCIYEGINHGWFRHAISYSAQVHALDLRWRHNPVEAWGSLRNFAQAQNADGSFPGGLSTGTPPAHVGFYHASWGYALRQLYRVHPDDDRLAEFYPALARYAHWLLSDRDGVGSGLIDIVNHWETGQEYAARYQAVDPAADTWKPLDTPLKGVDATVYAWETLDALAWAAARLGQVNEAAGWRTHADRVRQAVQDRLWDPASGFFYDVNSATGERIAARHATGFYPFRAGLADRRHLAALTNYLLNPDEFWTPFPVPAASLADPTACADGRWKGQRANCPWNGRAWLMTTSHVVEALARAALTFALELRPAAADLLHRAVKTTFRAGDPTRPTSYEYYNPLTGQTPDFRGTDDYMHSYLVDLIVQFAAGLQPQDDTIVVDPLPLGLTHFALTEARVRGQRVAVRWQGQADGEAGELTVEVDGVVAARLDRLGRVVIS